MEVDEVAEDDYFVTDLDLVFGGELGAAEIVTAVDFELGIGAAVVGNVVGGVSVGAGVDFVYLGDLALDINVGELVVGAELACLEEGVLHGIGAVNGTLGVVFLALLAAVSALFLNRSVQGVDIAALGDLGSGLVHDEDTAHDDVVTYLDVVLGLEFVAAETVAAVYLECVGAAAVVGNEIGGVAVLGADFADLRDFTHDVHLICRILPGGDDLEGLGSGIGIFLGARMAVVALFARLGDIDDYALKGEAAADEVDRNSAGAVVPGVGEGGHAGGLGGGGSGAACGRNAEPSLGVVCHDCGPVARGGERNALLAAGGGEAEGCRNAFEFGGADVLVGLLTSCDGERCKRNQGENLAEFHITWFLCLCTVIVAYKFNKIFPGIQVIFLCTQKKAAPGKPGAAEKTDSCQALLLDGIQQIRIRALQVTCALVAPGIDADGLALADTNVGKRNLHFRLDDRLVRDTGRSHILQHVA